MRYTRYVIFPKTQQKACLIYFKSELFEFPHNHLVIQTIALLLTVFFRTGNIERNSWQMIMFWFHSLSHLQSRVNETREWDWQWMDVKPGDANILLSIYFTKFISSEYTVFKDRIFHNATEKDKRSDCNRSFGHKVPSFSCRNQRTPLVLSVSAVLFRP
jgi:hypothetical protein